MCRFSGLDLLTAFAALAFLVAPVGCDLQKIRSLAPPAASSAPSGPGLPAPLPPAAPLTAPVPPLSPGAVLEDEQNTIGVFRTAAKSTKRHAEAKKAVEALYAEYEAVAG